ncbi:MAG: DUF1295 domain-containing protein [Spirochaetales bacterium]|nr:DUF1295 domain-containing protein [Spirochaetales bacterium]
MDFFISTLPAFFIDFLNSFSIEFVFMFVTALILSSFGFIKVVYFISTGYGFSIAGMAFLTLFFFRDSLNPLIILQAGLLAAYGLRLGIYLVIRNASSGYRKTIQATEYGTINARLPLKFLIWISVAVLYVIMFSPCLLNSTLSRSSTINIVIPVTGMTGIAVMVSGLLLESLADFQKARFKNWNPGKICKIGLFGIVRTPNYLGEIIFWAGNWTAGIAAYATIYHWVITSAGLILIFFIMIGSTRRLELSQDKRYANDPEYNAYIRKVPVIFPFLPIYSVKKWKIYLG